MLAGMLLCAGCFSPRTTRLPNLVPGNNRIERQAAQTKDPYPIADLGPELDSRPREFLEPRSQARLSKDKFYTWVRPELRAAPGYGPTSTTVPPWMAASPTGPGPAPAWAAGQNPYGPNGLPVQGYPVSPVYAPPFPPPGGQNAPIAVTPEYPLY